MEVPEAVMGGIVNKYFFITAIVIFSGVCAGVVSSLIDYVNKENSVLLNMTREFLLVAIVFVAISLSVKISNK